MHSLASSLAGLMGCRRYRQGCRCRRRGYRPGGRWQSRCRAACGRWGGSRGVAESATGGGARESRPVGEVRVRRQGRKFGVRGSGCGDAECAIGDEEGALARTRPQGRPAEEAPSAGRKEQDETPEGRLGKACQRQVHARLVEEFMRTGALVGKLGGGTRGRSIPDHHQQASGWRSKAEGRELSLGSPVLFFTMRKGHVMRGHK